MQSDYSELGERIRKIAVQTEFLLHSAGAYAKPVPIEKVVLAQHLRIEERSLHSILTMRSGREDSAVLLRDEKIIFVDYNASINRRRMSVAHELGHYILEQGLPTEGASINGCPGIALIPESSMEYFADVFAYCILLPYRVLFTTAKQWVRENSECLNQQRLIDELARQFQLDSVDVAMAYSLLRYVAGANADQSTERTP